MGHALMHSECCNCGRIFAYNPHRVPSIRVNGVREPVCKLCIDYSNPIRVSKGLAPFKVHPDAYSPVEESEL